jgi:hypothetical protein
MIKIKIKKIKVPQNRENNKNKKPKSIFWQLFNLVIFFLILVSAYSLLTKYSGEDSKRKEIPVSMNEIVKKINLVENNASTSSTTMKNIFVSGDKVSIEDGTNTLLVTQKETNESFLNVLKNYGVSTSTSINTLNNLTLTGTTTSSSIFSTILNTLTGIIQNLFFTNATGTNLALQNLNLSNIQSGSTSSSAGMTRTSTIHSSPFLPP